MSNTQISKAERDAMIAKVVAEVSARIARLEARAAAQRPSQAALGAVAKQILELYDQVVDVEIAKGLRTARPVRKRNASLAEQLREISADNRATLREVLAGQARTGTP